jgi:hypothetical protein
VESENIRVYLRIRPFIEREDNAIGDASFGRRATPIVQVVEAAETHTAVRLVNPRVAGAFFDGETFTFDAVGGSDISQEEVFETVAKPITENCLLGYNGTIFA